MKYKVKSHQDGTEIQVPNNTAITFTTLKFTDYIKYAIYFNKQLAFTVTKDPSNWIDLCTKNMGKSIVVTKDA